MERKQKLSVEGDVELVRQCINGKIGISVAAQRILPGQTVRVRACFTRSGKPDSEENAVVLLRNLGSEGD